MTVFIIPPAKINKKIIIMKKKFVKQKKLKTYQQKQGE